MTGQVTALGIRDGDPAVLNALVSRRGAAVLAYCERACPPAQAAEAAADAFARFRVAVIATPSPSRLDPEAALLAATRHAAADRAPAPAGTTAGPLGRLLGGKPPEQIAEVPSLLVARADGSLDPASEDRLNRLLDASAAARAAEERFHAAEYAYRTAVARPLPRPVSQQVLAAMAAVTATKGFAIAAVAAPVIAAPAMPEAERPEAEQPPLEEPPAEEPPFEEPPVEEPPVEEPPVEEPPVEEARVAAEAPPVEEPPFEEPPFEEPPVEEAPVEQPPVEEPLVHEEPQHHGSIAAGDVEQDPGATVEWSPPPPEPEHTGGIPRLASERPHFPGRSAFAPAAAVVTVAAIGALVASGAFGGNEETPQLDTGIVRPRAVNAIPEGEAKTVISDLRESAVQARRQRLADKAESVPAPPPAQDAAPPPAQAEEDTTTREERAPAPAEPEAENEQSPEQAAPEPEQPSGQADGGGTGGAVPDETP